MDFKELDFNEEFTQAFEALEHTRRHLFVTGKAGTGKSTLLQYFREKTAKNVVVLAPTGVAAINIKGQTIHSFFGFKPDITPETAGEVPVRKRRQKMFRELGAVIIDEVSMVRADLMDCIDIFLRLYGPDYDRPFGGIQMIFFGDLLQLPPVVGQAEEHIFKTHYPTPYFFSAKAFQSLDYKILQLTRIYRQKDEHFIRLLNAVREDRVEGHHWEALNRRFNPTHEFAPQDFYIVLTATNAVAERVNNQRLQNLPGHSRVYQGSVSGEFERKSMPAPESLELKAGAQIMLLNNDPDKRWVNGSLGKVLRIFADGEGEDVLMVELENGRQVDVQRHTWEIYQYFFDESVNALSSKVVGYFTQYPLKPAWAVTIHKSQGQTFERVVIDMGWGAFSHGQIYVALSRCTTLEGIVLKQPLNRSHILMDGRVLEFMKKAIVVLLLALWSGGVYAQTPLLDKTMAIDRDLSKIEDKQTDPNAWAEQNAQQPYIGLLSETDTVVHDDWSVTQDYHARVKIQKDTVKNFGTWPVYYNKARETITDIEAFLETPDGKKLQATDVHDLPAFDQSPLYADMRLKAISLPAIASGTVIDVRVKTRISQEKMSGQFWDEVTYPSIPTKYSRITYVFPENKAIRFSSFNTDKRPLIEKADGTIQYSYIFENTAYSENEPFMPPRDETLGVMSLSSIPGWKQVADWWRGQINESTVDDPAIRSEVADLMKDKTSSKDKLRAVMEFIQDNFRYVSMSMGDHSVDLHTTAEIFKAHYGDCKDLTVLAAQMLNIAGIQAHIGLFSGEFNGNPQNRLPDPSAFDHMLLEVTVDGKKYFVDPQTKGFDLGELPSSYDGAYVMVITSDSYQFKTIPVADESAHAVVSTSDIFVHEDGSADFQVQVRMPIEASQDFKSTWDAKSDSSKEKFFDNLQAAFAQEGKITGRQVKGLEDRYGPVEFDFKYAASHVYQIVNDMLLLKEQQQGDVPDFEEETRRHAVFIPTNSMITNRNTYHIPHSLRIDDVPKDFQLSTSFMDVSVKYVRGDGTITVESVYHLKRGLLALSSLGDVKRLRQELDKEDQEYIILRKA